MSETAASAEAGGERIRLLVAYGLELRRGDMRIDPGVVDSGAWAGR